MIPKPAPATRCSIEATYQVPDPEESPVLSVEDAAEILHIARGTAYRAVNDGLIPSIRIGRRVLIPTAGLRALLGLAPDGGVSANRLSSSGSSIEGRK